MLKARAHIRLQAIVLVVGVVLMGLKFWAWRITHSNAILSDALESIVNVVAGVFALYSLVLAAKPRDREHPYGHGKVEFISAGIEGTLVALAGVVIVCRAIRAWIAGPTVHDIEQGLVLAGVAALLNLVMGLVLVRRGRQAHSITMQASGTHLLSDVWSTAAMLIGLLLIHFTGQAWLDSLFALGFGLFILVQGTLVVRRSVAGIMDETDMNVAKDLVRILDEHRHKAWVDLHNFRVITFGSTLHVDCHVTLPYYYSLEQAHDEISTMDSLVNDRSGREIELFIHMDPCVPTSCPLCLLAECPVRKAPFVRRLPWTLGTALTNKKHGLSED
ncbi:MAG: cation diffusion facilitator family transporter [Flavobacteriales bacterium]